jgi:hypothetical protein
VESGIKCERCGGFFQPKKRQDARFCSAKCRTAAHRNGALSARIKAIDAAKAGTVSVTDAITDAGTVNPRRILAEIAADVRQPAAARVAACKALLADAPKPAAEVDELDPITRKALQLLNAPSSRLN